MSELGIIWIFFSYLLGSIPFGYIFSRLSGKDILEIGWRKTSGSNVFKNVGWWQGVLTGVLDLFKGWLAVYVAQELGFSPVIQILSGVAAVTGHNWSVFLKFAGGRGIGTLIGAFLALSPTVILWFSLIPLLALAIIWNAAIGTILLFIIAITLSIYSNQFWTVGLFPTLCLIPVFIKRLSPINELRSNSILIRNRLLFDNDEALLDLRIKRIFKKIKGNPNKFTKTVKPVSDTLLYSQKMGWKAAKYGVNAAKKPIVPVYNGVKKFVFGESEMVILEIKVDDFKDMMMAAAKKIVLHQEEINRINVFPVADKDTGYNLAATLLGIEGTISQKEYKTFKELTEDIKDAAMVNARGNAGLIYTGYLIEFLDRLKYLKVINPLQLALAMEKGIKAARLSVAEPVEGTILDVIKSAGEASYYTAKAKKEKNIIKVLEEGYKASKVSLEETKNKLEILRENDVVDAGALGFVKILEAWIENLKGLTPTLDLGLDIERFQPILETKVKKELDQKNEVIITFKKEKEINLDGLKNELLSLGDSIDVIESGGKIKIHIHTNQSDIVTGKFKDFSDVDFKVEELKIEEQTIKKKPLGLVIDQAAELPKDFLEKYDIEEIAYMIRFPNGEVIKEKEKLYLKMREAVKTGSSLPITSTPSFKDFLSVYQKALRKFERILVITISSKLSGTYSAARIARSFYKKPEKNNIFVFDCFAAEVAEGLMGVKAQELISQGKTLEEIINELRRFCPKVTLFGYIDDFQYLYHGGRVRIPKPLIKPIHVAQKLGIKILFKLKNGRITFAGIRFGGDIGKILAKEINRKRKNKEIRVAIAHAENEKAAEDLKKELEKKPKIKVLFTSSVSLVVGVHTGPGTLIVAFYPVE